MNKVRGIAIDEKKIFVYDDELNAFDGIEYGKITKEQLREFRKNPISSDFMPVKCKDDNLEEFYKEYINDGDKIKELTKGRINLYKTGSVSKTALNFFYQNMNKKKIFPEQITKDEEPFISGSMTGGLYFSEDYKGKGYKYDYCSYYPSIMIRKKFLTPVKVGKLMILATEEFDKLEYYFNYGIYRCKPINLNHKLVRTNPKQTYYTGVDLKRLKELGIKMQIIDDGKYNLLHYDRSCNKSKVFDFTIKYLYELKTKTKYGKLILNSLWGSISQKDLVTLRFKKGEDINIGKNKIIKKMIFNKNGSAKVVIQNKKSNIFESNFARMIPFLLAYARYNISKELEPHIDHIKRCHTDGFISNKKIDFENIKHNDNKLIGSLVFEGYAKKCIIKSGRVSGF
jgi:hypothetical protein